MSGLAQAARRRTAPVPHFLALPDMMRSPELAILDRRLAAAASACPANSETELRAAYFDTGLPVTADRYPGLFDELADYLVPESRAFDAAMACRKGLREFRVARLVGRAVGTAGRLAQADLPELLREIHRRHGAGVNRFRQGRMFTRAGGSGDAVEFPPPQLCDPLLGSLQAFIAANVHRHPALCAAVALVGVVHAHPFPDGNGRSARTLFNIILSVGCGSNHFLPISLFAEHSRGGFILKQRRALYGGEWSPIMEFLVDALRLSASSQAARGISGDPAAGRTSTGSEQEPAIPRARPEVPKC